MENGLPMKCEKEALGHHTRHRKLGDQRRQDQVEGIEGLPEAANKQGWYI